MICRNCSAVITDDNEICPSCGHDPAKRGRSHKTAIITTLLALVLFSSCVMIAVQINRNPSGTATTKTSSASSESAFFVLKQTGVQNSSTAVSDTGESESRTENTRIEITEKFSGFDVETFEITDPSDGEKAERALIKANKADFYENGEEYIEYICRSTIEKNRYAWLTIDFGDSTGIVFLSDNTGGADYGKIDKNGLISELYGSFIINRQSRFSYYPVFTPENTLTQEAADTQSTAPNEASTVLPTGEQTSAALQVTTEAATSSTTEKTTEAKTSENTKQASKTTKTSAADTKPSGSVSDSVVYITATGSKFHRDGCASLKNSRIKMNRSEAVNEGYEPCKRCNP